MSASKDQTTAQDGQKQVPAIALDFGGALAGPKASGNSTEQPSDVFAVLKDPPCGPNSKNPATRYSLF